MTDLGIAEKEAGNEAFKNGDYPAAVKHYSDAIEINPREPTYYSNRSAAYHKSGKFRQALEDGQQCVKLRENWPKGHFRVGEAYTGMGLFARASEAYSRALDIDPTDVTVRQALAAAEKMVYQKALEDDDDDMPLHPAVMPRSTPTPSGDRKEDMKERHQQIIKSRLIQGAGITSMDDYMKYRAAGGAKLSKDPTVSSFIATETPDVVPTQSRAAFLKSLGIDNAEHATESRQSVTPNLDDRSSTSTTPRAKNPELERRRAEFLQSLGITADAAAPTTGGGTTSEKPGSDWARIRGSDMVSAQSSMREAREVESREARSGWDRPPSTSSVNSSPGSTTSGESGGGNPPMSREAFLASLGIEPGIAEGGGGYGGPKRPMSKEEFIAALGDGEGTKTQPVYGRRSTPPKYSSRPGVTALDPANFNASLSAHAGEMYSATLPADSRRPDSGGYQRTYPAVNQNDTTALSKSVWGVEAKPLPTYDYKTAGALNGDGKSVVTDWMKEFRAKKQQQPELKSQVGDPKLEELKKDYSQFHYRKYKESTSDDPSTREEVLKSAILVEAMKEYDFKSLAR